MEPMKMPALPTRAFRTFVLVLGGAVGAMALWGPHLGIGSAGRIGIIRALALVAGLVLIGVAWAGPRIADVYSTTAVVLLNTLVALVVVEFGSAVVLFLMDRQQRELARPQESSDPAGQSPYFAGRPWAREYWREFGQAVHFRYHPYYLWRMAPFEGTLIRVDSAGLRVTPGADCSPGAHRVWVFGGSSAWGLGAPDDGTIPAHLQRLLAGAVSKPVCVVNFGQLGFTSTQDLIQLEWELRTGRRPDLAIFYGGVNDIVTAFQYNRAGLHWNFPSIAQKLEGDPQPVPPASLGLRDLLSRSNTYRLAMRVSGAARSRRTDVPGYRYEGYFESDTLAGAVVATYLANVRIAEALGRAYGFRVAFFWQPNALVGVKPLTKTERALREGDRIAGLTQKVYARLHSRAPGIADVHDLTDVFAHDSSLVYLDWHHLTPEANGTVAHAIVRSLPPEGAPSPSRNKAP